MNSIRLCISRGAKGGDLDIELIADDLRNLKIEPKASANHAILLDVVFSVEADSERVGGQPDNAADNLLFTELCRYPNGATAKIVADNLGLKAARASALLGKLAMYDIIDRVPNPEGRSNEYRYKVRRAA